MTAHDALTAAVIELAENGQRPRCSEPGGHDLWTSEDPEDRAQAARWCDGCPIILPCQTAGEGETAGVWGGIDRHTTNGQPRRKTK